MKTVHKTSGTKQVCAREGCTTVPSFGEEFCSVLHRRQHGLLHGWDAPEEEHSAKFAAEWGQPLQCARRGCTAEAAEGSVYCTDVHDRWDNPAVSR
jgi:hypothetical protein